METVLIQADSIVCQVAKGALALFQAMCRKGSGGLLLQSLAPTRGIASFTITMTLSAATTAFATTAFLLVASGIKNFKL